MALNRRLWDQVDRPMPKTDREWSAFIRALCMETDSPRTRQPQVVVPIDLGGGDGDGGDTYIIQQSGGGAGTPGADGATGPAGPAVFLAAEDGLDGEPGPPGVAGPTGAGGATGANGPAGPVGPALFMLVDDGADGERGPPGPTGPAGVGVSSDPFVGAYAPGSFTVATAKYAVLSRHLILTSTQRATLAGTATLRVT